MEKNMSRVIYMNELENELKFMRDAAKHFAEHPEHSTFGDLKEDSLLAIRWGMGDDCILVTKIEDREPRVYAQVIEKRAVATNS
jgi:hypothetical protein